MTLGTAIAAAAEQADAATATRAKRAAALRRSYVRAMRRAIEIDHSRHLQSAKQNASHFVAKMAERGLPQCFGKIESVVTWEAAMGVHSAQIRRAGGNANHFPGRLKR